jgi:hypothetical protein
MRRKAGLIAALMVLALPLVAAAQTDTGRITGAVADTTGSRVRALSSLARR